MLFPRNVRKNALIILGALALVAVAVVAQQLPKYSVDVNVVSVLATVRDKHGKIVNDLPASDFVLEEDGRPQTIRYFARETDLPLTLGLLVDTSLSQRRVLDQEKSATGNFLDTVLRQDNDSAFLIHFDREVELLQDLTSSRDKLDAAVRLLQTPQPEQDRRGTSGTGSSPGGGGYPGGGGGYPGGGRYPRSGGGGRDRGGQHGGGTLLYDSVFLASDELMQKQQGRKALIVLSDGVVRGSKTTLEHAIESAQRANTIVYSILFADDQAYGNGGGWERGGGMGGPWGRRGGGYPGRYPEPQQERPDGKKILQRISMETGGCMFQVSKKQTVKQIYQQIQDELRNQYSLGYTPDRAGNAADYHKIHLSTKQKDLVIQARDGYYSNKEAEAEKADQQK